MMDIVILLVLVLLFFTYAHSAAIDVCFLIDETQHKMSTQYRTGEKLQLAANISRCFKSRNADTKIAAVVYDNRSAKLGFNFKKISEILNNGFEQMIGKERLRRNIKGAQQKSHEKPFHKRNTIRVFSPTKGLPQTTSTDSPQTMAFLTAAEAVVAAESQSTGRVPNFKVLVISDSDVFPIMSDVKNYFMSAAVEINAVDLSGSGSAELKHLVSEPTIDHYRHSPVLRNEWRSVVDEACAKIFKAPVGNVGKAFFKDFSKVITSPLTNKKLLASYIKENPQYNYPAVAAENVYSDLDKYIEGDSTEYKWSPHPESEIELESPEDTPEEFYSADTKKDICKYLHEECKTYMEGGLCSDESAQAQGIKKFCKTTCGFCS